MDWIIEQAKINGGKIVEDVTEDTDENGSVRVVREMRKNLDTHLIKQGYRIYSNNYSPSRLYVITPSSERLKE